MKIAIYTKQNIMENSSKSAGIGFGGLLTIVFIVLKLTGFIDWSWWWVLSPLWIQIPLIIVISLVVSFVVTFFKK